MVKSTLKEKLFYGFGNMGSYIMWAFVASFVTPYVTYCLKFDSQSLMVFGTFILICRLCDGISDIIMGLVIEKTHSRVGKARLWFGISIVPLTVVFFFVFMCSGLSQSASLIVISILYFLFTIVFYTMNNVSFNAMLPRISEDPYDQSNVCTVNSVFTSVGSLAAAVTIPLLNAFGGKDVQMSWTILVSALATIAIVGLILCFVKVKEKEEIQKETKTQLEKGDLKRGLKTLFKTKYFYIAVVMFAINYYISLSVSSIGVYYAEYVLGADWYSSLFASLPMITMGIGLLATPFVVKKFGKKTALSAAIAFSLVGNLVGSCFPYSLAAGLTGAMIKGFGSAIIMSQLFTLAPDIVRYIQLKTGLKVEGLAASANSFGCKVGSGLGSAVVLWTLSVCGYISTEGAVQPQSAIMSFITVYWWVPLGLNVVLLVLSLLWDVDKKSKEITEQNSKEIVDNK